MVFKYLFHLETNLRQKNRQQKAKDCLSFKSGLERDLAQKRALTL